MSQKRMLMINNDQLRSPDSGLHGSKLKLQTSKPSFCIISSKPNNCKNGTFIKNTISVKKEIIGKTPSIVIKITTKLIHVTFVGLKNSFMFIFAG